MIKAPKSIVPGVTIKQQSIDVAIKHFHGEEPQNYDVGDAVELILLAKAFEIPTLELQASKHIEQQIERSFNMDGLAAAIRELYEELREDPNCAIGNEVVVVVVEIVARVCRRRLTALRKDPAFLVLLKQFPRFGLDILAAVADEDEVYFYRNEIKTEEQGDIPLQDSPQEALE